MKQVFIVQMGDNETETRNQTKMRKGRGSEPEESEPGETELPQFFME